MLCFAMPGEHVEQRPSDYRAVKEACSTMSLCIVLPVLDQRACKWWHVEDQLVPDTMMHAVLSTVCSDDCRS